LSESATCKDFINASAQDEAELVGRLYHRAQPDQAAGGAAAANAVLNVSSECKGAPSSKVADLADFGGKQRGDRASASANASAAANALVTLRPVLAGGEQLTAAQFDASVAIIRSRVASLGIKHAQVNRPVGRDEITILVSVDDARSLDEVGRAARLSFRPLLVTAVPTVGGQDGNASVPTSSPPVDQWAKLGFTPPTTPDAVAALTGDQATKLQQYLTDWSCDENVKPVDNPAKPIITCNQDGTEKYLLGPVIVKGTQVKTAQATGPGSVQGQLDWRVVVDLKSDGQRAWADYTSKHNEQSDAGATGNTVADTLDSRVIVASTIQSTITGRTEISGNFTQKSATDLANTLKFGPLPVVFQTVSVVRGP